LKFSIGSGTPQANSLPHGFVPNPGHLGCDSEY